MKRSRTDISANPTKKKLAGLPFASAAEMRKEEEEIIRNAWRDMTRSKVILELTRRDEFAFFKKFFAGGLSCKLGDGTELLKVSLDDDGMQILVNQQIAAGSAQIASGMESLIRGLSDTLMRNYLESLGVIHALAGKNDKPKRATQEN